MFGLFGRYKNEEDRRDELLSAYLDGELSERERERLEARLAEEPGLRAELRALHRTVSLMREMPQARAPRNFILRESVAERRDPVVAVERRRARQARPRARGWAAPLLTAATAVVSMLFVAVLLGDLLVPGVGGLASAPEPMMQRAEEPTGIVLEAAPTEEDSPESKVMPSPTLALQDSKEAAREEPQAEVEEEGIAEATRAAQAPPGTEATAPVTSGGGDPTEEVASLAIPTVAPTVTAATALTPTIPAEAPVVSEEELGLPEPSASEFDAPPPAVEERERDLDRTRVSWAALEIALGLAAAILAFSTIRVWRRRRR